MVNDYLDDEDSLWNSLPFCPGACVIKFFPRDNESLDDESAEDEAANSGVFPAAGFMEDSSSAGSVPAAGSLSFPCYVSVALFTAKIERHCSWLARKLVSSNFFPGDNESLDDDSEEDEAANSGVFPAAGFMQESSSAGSVSAAGPDQSEQPDIEEMWQLWKRSLSFPCYVSVALFTAKTNSSVKSLNIRNATLKCLIFLTDDNLNLLPTFHNLTHLYVYNVTDEFNCTSQVLFDILRKTPKLKVLHIPTMVHDYLDDEDSLWNSLPFCPGACVIKFFPGDNESTDDESDEDEAANSEVLPAAGFTQESSSAGSDTAASPDRSEQPQ
ncbi:hypothetical protein P8452_31627 [Trifolium repens]|nr:hypothetical protein P8452_31627 [Trifolium repens]